MLQLFTIHALVWSTHVPFAHRHGQFDFVQLLPLTSATHGSAQSVTSPYSAATVRRVVARTETISGVVCIVVDGWKSKELSSV